MPTAGCFSNYAERAVLEHVFNKATLLMPYVYVGLCTANPGEAGTGAVCNEVPNTFNYARATAYYWSDPLGWGFVENTAEILFPGVVGGSWGTITHFALLDDHLHGLGNMLIYGSLVESRELVAGSQPKFAIGEIGIQLE